mgnify:FL=1
MLWMVFYILFCLFTLFFDMSVDVAATFRATPNIALVKYWGKRDASLNLPVNSSLSVTLADVIYSAFLFILVWTEHQNNSAVGGLLAIGCAGVQRSVLFFVLRDRNREKPLSEDRKIQKLVQQFRDILRSSEYPSFRCPHASSNRDVERHTHCERLANCCIRIETQNSFPTASGMASSASGFACLVKALATVYGVLNSPEEEDALNAIARRASGSACRSMYGGLVFWDKGILSDGSDSIAVRFLHWAHGIASNRGRKLLALLAREHLCRVPVRESGGQYGRNEPLRGNESEHGDP